MEKSIKELNAEIRELKEQHNAALRFPQHIQAHFKDSNPDWHVVCKICHRTYENITGSPEPIDKLAAIREGVLVLKNKTEENEMVYPCKINRGMITAYKRILGLIKKIEGDGK